MKKVGVATFGYPEKRNFADHQFEKYTMVKKQNLNKLSAWAYQKRTGKIHQYYWNSFRDFNTSGVDLLHLFNGINLGKTPWITTYETSLPRWGDVSANKLEKGVELLAGSACKQLLALSECAHQIQLNWLEEHFPQYKDQIAKKITTLHPPQKLLVEDLSAKSFGTEKVQFCLIGSDFFRKGGREVLQAFDLLYKEGFHNWKLIIISKMQFGDYASRTTEQDLVNAKQLIEQYPENIELHGFLPNTEVLEILKTSHVGLLPTWGDTYGYSVLESQAAGCPVITTNLRALPEINNNDCGWLLDVPLNERKDGQLDMKEDRAHFQQVLQEQLTIVLREILSDPKQLKVKAQNSLARIGVEHDPLEHAKKLEALYDRVLTDC